MIVRQGVFRGERATGNISGFAVGKNGEFATGNLRGFAIGNNLWVSLRQKNDVGLRLEKFTDEFATGKLCGFVVGKNL